MTHIKFVVDYRIPSLNRLFAMTHWERHREKRKAQVALLLALQACADDCSTRTTSPEEQNTFSTAYAMLASYTGMPQTKSRSLSAKGKAKSSAPKSN